MLRRKHPPNAGKWNGLGGKIEAGETPLECVGREMMEEAGMDVSESSRYAGVVTWSPGADPTSDSRGMHAFVAEVETDGGVPEGAVPTPEGVLAWKPLGWVCDRGNDSVVGNIPSFLPTMLGSEAPMEYRCEYEDGRLASLTASPLASPL